MISVEAAGGEGGRVLVSEDVEEEGAEVGIDEVIGGDREDAKAEVQELVIVGGVEAIDRRQASKAGVGMAY